MARLTVTPRGINTRPRLRPTPVPYYAPAPTGVSATDTANLQNAINTVLVSGQKLVLQAGVYKFSQLTINMDALGQTWPGITIEGQSLWGTELQGDGTASPAINVTSSASVNRRLVLEQVRVRYIPTVAGTIALQLWNVLHWTLRNCLIYSDRCALSVQGSGNGVIDNCELIVQGSATTPYAALWIGAGNSSPGSNDGTLTSSGPVQVIAGQSTSVVSAPAIVIEGGSALPSAFAISFYGHTHQASGVSQTCSVKIDGAATAVAFHSSHGESNYNTANTGVDFLIGSVSKPYRVAIYDPTCWGQGNSTNYQKYAIGLAACKNFALYGGTFSKRGFAHGYDSGIVHFASGYPAVGDLVDIRGVNPDDTASPVYADDNGLVPASYAGPYQRPTIDQGYKQVITRGTQINAAQITGATTAVIGPINVWQSNRADAFFYFDPADWQAYPGALVKLRVKLMIATNGTAPGASVYSMVSGLVPSSGSPSGGLGAVNWSNGGFTGSVAQDVSAAGNGYNLVTADFNAPAAGFYALAISFPSAMAANSAVAVTLQLQAHCVN